MEDATDVVRPERGFNLPSLCARGRADYEAHLPNINYYGGGILQKLDLSAKNAFPVHNPQTTNSPSETLATTIGEPGDVDLLYCNPNIIVERSTNNKKNK